MKNQELFSNFLRMFQRHVKTSEDFALGNMMLQVIKATNSIE